MLNSRLAGAKLEKEIAKLVKSVRDNDCETSFVKLREYISQSIAVFEKKYRIPGCDADEIEQECLFALRYKAIEDFDSSRGKFKSFAILCIKRHLFSLIKGNKQHKRIVLNSAISIDDDHSDGDNLSLSSLITRDDSSVEDVFEQNETFNRRLSSLLSKLSRLEKEVLQLYIKQLHYDEIVASIKEMFPNRTIKTKSIDNALVRARLKAKNIIKNIDFDDI